MLDINAEFYKLITEMREYGATPAPNKGGSYNNMLRYREAREKILERFLAAFAEGYRLGKEDAEAGGKDNNVPTNEPLTQDELDKMDYDKVWIDYEDDCGEWALVCDGYIYNIDTLEGAGLDFAEYMHGERLKPNSYKVYRRPPERQED